MKEEDDDGARYELIKFCYTSAGMTNYRIGPHRTTSDRIGGIGERIGPHQRYRRPEKRLFQCLRAIVSVPLYATMPYVTLSRKVVHVNVCMLISSDLT